MKSFRQQQREFLDKIRPRLHQKLRESGFYDKDSIQMKKLNEGLKRRWAKYYETHPKKK